MQRVIAYMIRYPVWVSVLMFAVILFGMIALTGLRYSFFPETIPRNIIIEVDYPGASPEEVAESVVLKIEESLDGQQGVERITSVSLENRGVVTVETVLGSDIQQVVADLKNAVDRISSFPADAEKPVIYEQLFRAQALTVALYGETDLHNLKQIAEDLRDELLVTKEISQVVIGGIPDLEFSIEVSESNLRRYGLSFADVQSAVARHNINVSGGKVETDDEEILIRSWGRDYEASDLLAIPIRGTNEGTIVLLKDVATVTEQWKDVPDKLYYNGQNAATLVIQQTEDEDMLEIAVVAKEILADFNARHTSVQVASLFDRTIPLTQRVELLIKNGLIGLVLVMICLGFFLNLRLSFWVAVSIPFSFAGMFIIANAVGITLNVLSLAGMIVVVGILVDDAIVVGENIFAHYERGEPALQAAINGAREVTAPVFASVITTAIVFTAFFFLHGRLGEMLWEMGLVVVASLIFSLIEAFLILPSHLAHSKALGRLHTIPPIRQKIEAVIDFMTHRIYGRVLRNALNHKWIVIVLPLALILITVGLVGGGLIGVTFFPNVDGDEVPINLSLVSGTQEADTDSVLARMERICWQVNDDLKSEREDGRDVITEILRVVGSNDLGESGSHTGKLDVQLLDGEHRGMLSFDIANRIRDAIMPVPEAVNIAFGNLGRFGKAVSISLLGNDVEQLETAAELLKTEMQNFTSLKDVTDTNVKGRREIDISLKPRAYALGFTLQDIAGQVRQGFFGQEVQRIQRGRDEIRVWVRYNEQNRAALGQLDHMRIRTSDGAEYPFGELATYSIGRGVSRISRLDRNREIKVEASQANVREDLPPILDEIRDDVLPRVLAQVQGVSAKFEGQSREQQETVNSLKVAFSIALLAMMILVILVFRSYAQMIIVFSLIPIGIIGAFLGHGLQGLQVSLLSMIGIMALSGIIINDSIVFVDKINRLLREGQSVPDAVYNAGIARFRPILLTTLTTSLGMAPLILETSRQAQFLIPMAASVAYGLLFGTVILLIILPASFLALNRLRVAVAHTFVSKSATPESVEPAVKELTSPFLQPTEAKEVSHA